MILLRLVYRRFDLHKSWFSRKVIKIFIQQYSIHFDQMKNCRVTSDKSLYSTHFLMISIPTIHTLIVQDDVKFKNDDDWQKKILVFIFLVVVYTFLKYNYTHSFKHLFVHIIFKYCNYHKFFSVHFNNIFSLQQCYFLKMSF